MTHAVVLIEAERSAAPKEAEPAKRGRGRPRKDAAEKAGLTVVEGGKGSEHNPADPLIN